MTDEIDLPLSELDLHPENMRGRYDDIDELKNSLEVEGQREALLVVPAPGGGYWVVNGNRRLLALRKLGAPTARCHVVEMSRRDQLIHMGITALSRRDVDPISEARHYNRLIEGEGETQVSLARALAYVLNVTVEALLDDLDLPPAVRKQYRHFLPRQVSKLVVTVYAAGEDEAEIVAAQCRSLRRAIRQLREAPAPLTEITMGGELAKDIDER